jgi:hypothetical protein
MKKRIFTRREIDIMKRHDNHTISYVGTLIPHTNKKQLFNLRQRCRAMKKDK